MEEIVNIGNNKIPREVTVWYKNISLWTNIVTVVVLILTTYCGIAVSATLQASILAIINILLQSKTMVSTQAKATRHNKSVRSRITR
jgi:hypothetical protein